jgi:hypothetical protein
MHQYCYRPAPVYETATTRRFYHARTETLRSCTVEAVEFCRAMCDPKASVRRVLYSFFFSLLSDTCIPYKWFFKYFICLFIIVIVIHLECFLIENYCNLEQIRGVTIQQYIDHINRMGSRYAYRIVRFVSRYEYVLIILLWQSTYNLISTFFTLWNMSDFFFMNLFTVLRLA